jgi:putative ABC transport system permease protein
MAMLRREVRRFFRASPLLSSVGVGVVALGIGASGLALALLWAFSSLVYPGMRARGYATVGEETSDGFQPVAFETFEKIRSPAPADASLAAYSQSVKTTLDVGGGIREWVQLAAVSNGFFSAFTNRLSAGEDFGSLEASDACTHKMIFSAGLARRVFGSSRDAVGLLAEVNGLPWRIVGVAPASFDGLFGARVQGWVPASCALEASPGVPQVFLAVWRQFPSFYIVAASQRDSSAGLAAKLSRSLPLRTANVEALHAFQGLTIDPTREAEVRRWLRLGWLLALSFTIVSALNYALLLLVRVPRYAEEVRLRRALGAGSGRLMAELMVGPAVTVGAAVVGAVAFWVCGLVLVSRFSSLGGQVVRGSWHLALLAFGVQVPLACVLTLFIALVPAVRLLRDDGGPRLEYTSTSSRQTSALMQAVVAVQIACCMATWILAGMVISAAVSLTRKPLGFDPAHLVVVDVGVPPDATFAFTTQGAVVPPPSTIKSMLSRLAALPGASSASFADDAPFGEAMREIRIQRMSASLPEPAASISVSPEFFQTLGARLMGGRTFSWDDVVNKDQPTRIVVNEALGSALWPGGNPVGQSVRLSMFYPSGGTSQTWVAAVIGVVENVGFLGSMESPQPTVFLPLHETYLGFYLMVRGSALRDVQAVAGREAAIMPHLRVERIYSVSERVRSARWRVEEHAYFALAGAAVMALLSYTALYAALAYYVSTRRRELAIRITLGAEPQAVRRLVLGCAMRCAGIALLLSVPLCFLLAELSASEFLGPVSWSLPRAVLLSAACVGLVGVVALVPAGAATRTRPADLLRAL